MLRDLIPKNDQKRDKASFLLEVRIPFVLCLYVDNTLPSLSYYFDRICSVSYSNILYLYAGYRVYTIFTGEGKFV